MNILIIGSGISAINVAKTFLEYNHKVYLIDSGNVLEKESIKNKRSNSFLPNIKKSPKYNNKYLALSLKKFKKKYNIKTRNFFLVSGLISGGLSNFWGAGLEIPDSNYLKKYNFGKSIMREQHYVDKELKIDKRKFSFFNFFYDQKIFKKMLKKIDKSIFFSKFLLGVEHYNKKRLTIQDYNNVDLLSSFNKQIYNAKFQLYNLLNKKNFYYIPNTFVKNIKKKKNYVLMTDNKKKINIRFNKIIISCGTIGSTLLVDKILDSSQKYRLFHTPILKLMYFSFFLPFKIKNSIKFSLPLLRLNVQNKKNKFSGSLMYLDNISNFFLGINKFNILFSFIKKFFFVGNLFLPPEYSNTYIDVRKNKAFIYSNNGFDKKQLILILKKKLNSFLFKYNLIEIPFQNLKFFQNGSDAHYTSTLINKKIDGKKILNDNLELKNFKNIHVIDGSSIKEGLHYPTYFLMLYARFISKKIILDDKKNKNKY